jgi:hypothetical protein
MKTLYKFSVYILQNNADPNYQPFSSTHIPLYLPQWVKGEPKLSVPAFVL